LETPISNHKPALVGPNSTYRWFVVILGALTMACTMGMPAAGMIVLFDEISLDLNLDLVQIGVIVGVGPLVGLATGIFGGAVGDQFGTNKTLAVGAILGGVFGALRGISDSFISLIVMVSLASIIIPAIPVNVHKACGQWFPSRQLGLANGIASMGMASGAIVGSMISATLLSPLLGSWRYVLVFYGILSIMIGITWLFVRPIPGQRSVGGFSENALSVLQGIRQVANVKRIWALGLSMMAIGGANMAMMSYLPLYLRDIGWSSASADGTVSLFYAISMVSVIPITMLSDRLGSRKLILVLGGLAATICAAFLAIPGGSFVLLAICFGGIFRDGFMAIIMTTITETDGIGSELSGAATGMVTTLSRIGGVFSPPVGNSLTSYGSSTPFVLWSVLALIGTAGMFSIKERRKAM
jgi:cyanate permease